MLTRIDPLLRVKRSLIVFKNASHRNMITVYDGWKLCLLAAMFCSPFVLHKPLS